MLILNGSQSIIVREGLFIRSDPSYFAVAAPSAAYGLAGDGHVVALKMIHFFDRR